jgi:hypothetical protein
MLGHTKGTKAITHLGAILWPWLGGKQASWPSKPFPHELQPLGFGHAAVSHQTAPKTSLISN